MEKKLKDYAHYYLGGLVLYEGNTFILTPERLQFIIDDKFDYKLILRPIMNMREEEARDFFGEVMQLKRQFGLDYQGDWWKKAEGYISVQDNRSVGLNWYVILKPSGEPNMPCFNCTYNMTEAIWLLKRGFDLFGLIAAGVAVAPETIGKN